ncbi:restriction endonuclease subunit S [Corynebacterium xerosis]|uniref:restriction endonuclease subunit S n=1 Tax=Corynebacterium xerosis TaxID=1725 RepID=UPI000EB522A3|nr:restriction endonuclease subunit S [Corynebacterium xerosis]AYJ31989.1 restriction endonuclease subunit S [Corynebacterium xerosis]
MSRIDELIQDLCPSGVEYEAIAELITRSEKVHWDDLDQTDEFRYIDLSTVDRVTHSINGTETITKENAPSRAQQVVREGDVLFGTTRPMLKRYCIVPADYDGQVASTGFCVLRANTDRILTNFLFHLLGTATFYEYVQTNERGASYPAIPDNVVKKFRIPVPPLEVQREIVRVLDKFTQLEAELEAELEARRAQYQHYLHSAVLPDGDIEWTTLGEAALNHDRKRKPVTRADRQGGEYPYYGANGVQDYVHDYIFDGTFLLVGEDGSVKNADGTPILNWASGKIWVNNHAHVLTAAGEHFNLRYLYYYLATVDVTIYVTGGTQPKINQSNLNKIPVPLVPRSFQDDIVGVLDKFDALVNDISVGLPAELNARRMQYEHYRDRLLTFKEVI